jgi:hypothetical protein
MHGNVSGSCGKLSTPLFVRSLTVAVLAFLIVLAVPSVGTAQILYGTLVGNVKDPTGAVVPGATVTVVQTETGLTRQVKTDSRGGYTFSTLSAWR